MTQELTCFSDARTAWKYWNFMTFEQRFDALSQLAGALRTKDSELADVVRFHIESARPFVSVCHELNGPTGETNELYTAGRGVALMLSKQEGPGASKAIIALISAALIAGNSIVMSSEDSVFTSMFSSVMNEAGLPEKLIQVLSEDQCTALISSDIRSVGFVGSESDERQLNRAFAKRDGVIVSFVSETDLVDLPVAHDPYLSLRFITERTRTINITAIGGNASLLEMGHSPH
jgi:delta 1-pyrroline-5-carboxylate dehydrogenase